MSKTTAKVAAYITCYQDQDSVNRCIQAITNQSVEVVAIFIVDNSKLPLSIRDDDRGFIIVRHYPNNIGIAQGLSEAIEWSINQGYDFLWAFDQDSVPEQNCLEILLSTYAQLSQKDSYKIGIIAPTAFDPRSGTIVESASFANDHFAAIKHKNNVEFYECDSPITSGSLISLDAARKIAPPCAELFIDGIDLDYGFRLKQNGFHNLIVTKALMRHDFGTPIQVKFINQYRYIQKYSDLRYYYICRNHTYLETRFSQSYFRLTSLMRRIKILLTNVVRIALYEPDKKNIKILACLIGTYHGIIGKLNKKW